MKFKRNLIAMWPKSIFSKLAQPSWGHRILYLTSRVLARVTRGRGRLIFYLLVAQPVPEKPNRLCRSSPDHSVFLIDAHDPIIAYFPRPADVIARRFATGATCLVAKSGERFAGFLWLAHGFYDEDEVQCRYQMVQPDISVWDFDVYVEPAFRMGRTFARLWEAANSYLAEKGVCWSFSRISAFNQGSLLAHARLGLHELFSVTFLCLGQLQIAFISAPPFLHVSLSERTWPTLLLRPPI